MASICVACEEFVIDFEVALFSANFWDLAADCHCRYFRNLLVFMERADTGGYMNGGELQLLI